jgi:thiol-disulfide isomerase/thioredoxin
MDTAMLRHFTAPLLVFIASAAMLPALGACDSSTAAAPRAEQAAANALRVEPATLDMGDLVPEVPVVKRVKLTNTGTKPLKVTNAVADCSCTTPTWPSEPIAPGATVETDITMKAGPKQGVTLTKRVTFTVEGGELAFLNVVGKVGLFIELSTDLVRAPGDDVAQPAPETITMRAADGKAFKVVGVDPAIATADNGESALNHSVRIDWLKWRELKKSTKLTILTDHPVTPELQVAIRRTVTPAAGAPPTTAANKAAPAVASIPPLTVALGKKPRAYRVVQPGIYPGAPVTFPPLGTFVVGEPLDAFARGQVVVFEFFATTCGHCKEAAPALEALSREYTAKGWKFISITSEDDAKVREYFSDPKNAEMYPHAIALDPGSKAQKVLQDPTFEVKNPRLFVARDGVVLWYGHPDVAEEPFAKIAAGTWDPSSIRAEFITNALAARARSQTNNLVTQCEKDGKWQELLDLFESIAVAIPERASTFELQRFGTMIGPADMSEAGYAYGKQLAVHYAKDIASLRTIARTTLNSPRVKQRDLDFAFAIARAADTIGKGQDARAAEILALAYFSRGDRDNAIANQERAIALQTDAKLKAQYEAQLAKYRTDEPKPVPYTPKPGTPGAAAPAATPPAGGGEGDAH